MKTLFFTLITAFIVTLNTTAFSAERYDQKHDNSGQHREHQRHHDHEYAETSEQDASYHAEGDHADAETEEHNEHDHEAEKDHQHRNENISYVEDDIAKHVGILTASAGPQELHQTITVFGSIVSGPEQLSHVRARFEGMIKSVKFSLGDRVTTGDVLAEIESNESLNTYTIRSPISGRIVQRHANTGEVTQNQILFSIANFDTVWAELRIYPAQQSIVSEGQSVHIFAAHTPVQSSVDHMLPSMESPYQLARVKLDNAKKLLSPGLMTEARIETGRFPVSIAVAKGAVQMLGGRQGVFVKLEDEYHFKPLVLGRNDDYFYEVIEGLESGSEYVNKNSYLIKADIEKSAAKHEH